MPDTYFRDSQALALQTQGRVLHFSEKKGGEVRPLDCLPLFEAGLAEAAGILLTTASRRIWWAPASQAVPAPPSAAEPSPHSPPSEASPPLSLRRVGTR